MKDRWRHIREAHATGALRPNTSASAGSGRQLRHLHLFKWDDSTVYMLCTDPTTCATKVWRSPLRRCRATCFMRGFWLRWPPIILDAKYKRVVLEQHSFWKLANDYVRLKGPFDPLTLFKHGSQAFYFRTKGGVDGSTQYRSTLRSSIVVFKWEQKLSRQSSPLSPIPLSLGRLIADETSWNQRRNFRTSKSIALRYTETFLSILLFSISAPSLSDTPTKWLPKNHLPLTLQLK